MLRSSKSVIKFYNSSQYGSTVRIVSEYKLGAIGATGFGAISD